MANQLGSHARKGILRQMPGLTAARIVPASSVSELSAYTQQGAYPDVPVLNSDVSSMFLKASGDIPEDEAPFDVLTLHGGLIGLDEAQFMWSQAVTLDVINTGTGKGSLDSVRGWEWPGYVRHYEALVFDDEPEVNQLDSCTLSDGRIYQVYVSDDGIEVEVILAVRALDGTWTETVIYASDDTLRVLFLPCLVLMPDDRVVLYMLNYVVDGTDMQIEARVIHPLAQDVDDYEVFCLKSVLDIDTYGSPDENSQLRGAMKPDGSVILIMRTELDGFNRILQLGSYDYGHSFTVTSFEEEEPSEDHDFPDVVYVDGVFVVTYVARDITVGVGETRDTVYAKSVGHYFDSIVDAPVLESFVLTAPAASSSSTCRGQSLVATPDGRLYSVTSVENEDTTETRGLIHYSADLGSSWANSDGDDMPNVGYSADADNGPSWAYFATSDAQEECAALRNLTATYQGNRVYVGALFAADTQSGDAHEDGSLVAFYLGGWSNQQKTFIDNLIKTPDGQLGYETTFFGFIDPQYNGWSLTSSGTGSSIPTTGGRLSVNTSNGGVRSFSRGGGTSIRYASVEWSFQSTLYDTMTQGDVGVEVQIDNGTSKYRLGVYYLSAGGIRIRDRVTATTIANVPIDFGDEYTYRLEVYNNRFQLWYRLTSSDDDQVWERAIDPFDEDGVYTGYELTAEASTGSSTAVAWGNFFATTTGATGDALSLWRMVEVNFGLNLNNGGIESGIRSWFLSDYTDYSSTDTFHNGYPFVAQPVWVTDGVYVTSAGGPTYYADEWELTPAYQYAVENIMPEVAASPLKGWRSETDDVDVCITWLVGTGDIDAAVADVEEEWPGNETFACFLLGTNFKTASLWGVNSSNAEVKILDITLTRWSGLTYQTHGNTAIVAAGGGTQYVGYDELADSYILLSGETTPKRITGNTEGQLNTNTKTATIRFEASGTEDQGVDADAGNLIFGTQGFWVCHDPPATTFKAYKLKIGAQETAEGYFKIDKALFGPLMVFGRAPSFGHTTEIPQENTLRNKTNAGHTESRVYNKNPRVKQLSWTDNIDETGISSALPDYIQFASPADEPAALYSDTARQIYGLFQALNGSDELVVYCDALPATSNTGELRPERMIYGRVTSSYQESNVIGEEGSTEVKQVTNLTIEEER